MDKNAAAVPAWAATGFWFQRTGRRDVARATGQSRAADVPRHPREAIVNRMGFNNPGAEAIAEKLAEWKKPGRWPKHPVGINLGKSKITPLDRSRRGLREFISRAAAAPGFFRRQCQFAQHAEFAPASGQELRWMKFSRRCRKCKAMMRIAVAPATPILVKVAPDLSFEALDEILELVGPRQIAGIVATNTTITRPASERFRRATRLCRNRRLERPSAARAQHGNHPASLSADRRESCRSSASAEFLTPADAWEKITAGASLVQIYTGSGLRRAGDLPEHCERIERADWRNRAATRCHEAVGCEVNDS